MTFDLRYRQGTKYGTKFRNLTFGCSFPTRERAEEVRLKLTNIDQIEVIEVEPATTPGAPR